VATEIVARFDHNWRITGMSRVIDSCPGLKYSELLREELRCQLGSLDVFRRVPLGQIPEPRTVHRAAARVDVSEIDPEPQLEPIFPADMRGLGMARAVNGKALRAIMSLCDKRVRTEAFDVPAQIGKVAGRFTDVVTSTAASMFCVEMPKDRPRGSMLFDLNTAMSGLGATPLVRVHGLPLRIDQRLGDFVALCVNRHNMLLGLGDGRFSYDHERERLHMSVKFALDVSRAARGVMIDFRDNLDPGHRSEATVRERRARAWAR